MTIFRHLPRFRRAYRELEVLAERERWPRERIEAWQLARINSVWAHATRHVSHYRALREATGAPESFASLEEYRSAVPVLPKDAVRSDPQAFLSERAEPGSWRRTGGSTGAPMANYWSTAAHREMLRSRYRSYHRWGIDPFDRTVFLWGHSASFAPGARGLAARVRMPLEDRLRNRLRLSAYDLGPEDLRDDVRRIVGFRPAMIYGYPSGLYLLAREAERMGFACEALRLSVLTGEPALPHHIETIERVCGVPAMIEYGSIECGVMASEAPDRTLRVREDMVMLETIPGDDGRWEIVVTVLGNPSFPLLRYAIADVTDAPIRHPREGFAILPNVSGRDNELVVTRGGGRLHSSRFDALFKYRGGGGIRRFRVRQRADGALEVKLEPEEGSGPLPVERIEKEIGALVEGWPVRVEVVNRIPLTTGGKHRLVTSDFEESQEAPRAARGNGARGGGADPEPPRSTDLPERPDPEDQPVERPPSPVDPRARAARLRQLLAGPDLFFLMEAHNGLSARIAEEAGFPAIWASGLSISAALGVRDSNEASWTQVLEVLEFMSDAVRIPILVDGDTGHGNFNNMRRLVRKLEQRGIAGVCIEDKLFPKTNSFLRGTTQPLADVEEFCGRIRAGLDARRSEEFVIVARVEAFIAGWGLEEALRRARAYADAGADAILIHSARRDPSEVLAFADAWQDRLPVVVVPTKYYATPTEVFRAHGVRSVIWANHLLRAGITAMERTARQIFEDESLVHVEERIAPLAEVFRLQGAPELAEAEKRYLPQTGATARAIVLAAAHGPELGALTDDRPKSMVRVGGAPILEHIVRTYRDAGVRRIAAVRGWRKEAVDLPGIDFHDVDDERAGEVAWLHAALPSLEGPCVISYGDVLFKKYVVQEILDTPADFAVAVDAGWRESRNRGRPAEYVRCSSGYSRSAWGADVRLEGISREPDPERTHGEWMGFLKVSAAGAEKLRSLLTAIAADPERLARMDLMELLGAIVERHEVRVVYTTGAWFDVDRVEDVVEGGEFR